MGVQGLTGFVEERGVFFTELRVRDTKLVIDGSSLYHCLCFAPDADFRRGGDYGAFAAAVRDFFGVLRACGVAPFVFAEPAEAVDNVLKYLKKHQREEIRELLCSSMEDYAPSDVNLEDFFQNGSYECEAARKADVPQWVLDAFAKGKLSPFVINALILRSTFLRVQVENMQRPSAHGTALPIRQVIYGLLLRVSRSTEDASPSKQTNELPVVCEFDRCQKTLKKTFVQAASLPPDFCDDRFPLDKLMEVPVSCRQMLFLETLGVKMSSLEPFPSHLQLPVAVTCYWIRCSEPKVKLNQLKALLLMIVSGELQRITDDPGAILNADFILLLGRLYTGTLVHRLYQELKSAPSVENLFLLSPKMTQLYLVLLNTMESVVSPDFFQKMTKTKSESCKKRKASHKKKTATRHAVPETQHSCNVNRFAALEVDD
ncbi:hypothetical protein EK904_005229 [Melospiza melodia maxima]|nr:hypothetical protein EK904_005229 [Melospiza melodia maxima]